MLQLKLPRPQLPALVMITATSFTAAPRGGVRTVFLAVPFRLRNVTLTRTVLTLLSWSSSRRASVLRPRLWISVTRLRTSASAATGTAATSASTPTNTAATTSASALSADAESCSRSSWSNPRGLQFCASFLGLRFENFFASFFLTWSSTSATSLAAHNYLLVRLHIAEPLQASSPVATGQCHGRATVEYRVLLIPKFDPLQSPDCSSVIPRDTQ